MEHYRLDHRWRSSPKRVVPTLYTKNVVEGILGLEDVDVATKSVNFAPVRHIDISLGERLLNHGNAENRLAQEMRVRQSGSLFRTLLTRVPTS